MLPARRKPQRYGIRNDGPSRCDAHLKWVRGHACSIPGCENGPIEAAHVRNGTDGGMGMKPSDCWVISLCSAHHAEQHAIGEPAFQAKHKINMRMLALAFAAKSTAWQRYLRKRDDQ